ncbi:O-antigen ligase family protein [Verrucomicrobiota bacterium]
MIESSQSHKPRRSRSIPRAEKNLVFALFLLVAYPTWVRGGTQVAYQWPLPWLGLLALVAAFVSRLNREKLKGKTSSKALGSTILAFLKDPILYIGLLFLGLLTVQWWNAGRTLQMDWANMKWIYGPPRIAWLPSAINKADAAEMLRWFIPAISGALALRVGIKHRRSIKQLLTSIVVSAGVLAFFSLLQFIFAKSFGWGTIPSESYFFTSFGYANHAGMFFNLVFCTGIGLLFSQIFRSKRLRPGQVWLLGVSCAFCFFGAGVSLGRAALLLSWVLLLTAGIYALAVDWHSAPPGVKFSKIIFLFGLACVVFFVVHGAGRDVIANEFISESYIRNDLGDIETSVTLDINRVSLSLGDRPKLIEVGIKIWKDYLWFGAGGWSQSHLIGFYVEKEDWGWVASSGKANTHYDLLQFMTEFGLIGTGLLVLFGAFFVIPVIRLKGRLIEPFPFFILTGVMLTVVYSFFDLPFRSSAILITWMVSAVNLRLWVTVRTLC